MEVFGDANDYVGKGLSGGQIVIRPVTSSTLVTQENAIIRNTVLWVQRPGGCLQVRPESASLFAIQVRMLGRGCGANGCEYMTGGTVVILGPVGDNFGAGMTGGMAFVYDTDSKFIDNVNPDTVYLIGFK